MAVLNDKFKEHIVIISLASLISAAIKMKRNNPLEYSTGKVSEAIKRCLIKFRVFIKIVYHA